MNISADAQARLDAIRRDAASRDNARHGAMCLCIDCTRTFLLDLLSRQSEALEMLRQERDEAVRLQNANATAAVNVAELLQAAERDLATLRAQMRQGQAALEKLWGVAACVRHRNTLEFLVYLSDTLREAAKGHDIKQSILLPDGTRLEAALRSAPPAQE